MSYSNLSDSELFHRYLGQAAELPGGVRVAVAAAFGDSEIVAYALADLDGELRLNPSWLVLGRECIALVAGQPESNRTHCFRRTQVRALSSEPGLSCQVLRLH